MKTILVPTDFSQNAYNALFYATRLFKDQECKFYLLNTFEVDTPILTSRIDTTKGNVLYTRLSCASKDGLAETLHAITRDCEDYNHSFETLSISKKLVETVQNTIKRKKIDLVVMGTQGATRAKEYLLGSNTIRVVQGNTLCPTLMIPSEYVFTNPKDIAFSTDLRRFYGKDEIAPITRLLEMFKAELHILHIRETGKLDEIQQYNYDKLLEHLGDVEVSVHWLEKQKEKSESISNYIREYNIRMLFMVNYKHSFIERMTRESVIRKIGLHVEIPFMVIPGLS
ncbi:universal stress protein [Aquimarina intermedia]|uniref:Nucleotide-binding universal stress UspA family protein n=1 Tax=Aquimarina intermedia TaxID=350814 RepID=A0A5S5C782_9FLAO|nr:universal stress protein [Aquimarina intermedia]TYP74256.1 nucleotide-binding universal stress UspA family protein [Aquimarina intermedia]